MSAQIEAPKIVDLLQDPDNSAMNESFHVRHGATPFNAYKYVLGAFQTGPQHRSILERLQNIRGLDQEAIKRCVKPSAALV